MKREVLRRVRFIESSKPSCLSKRMHAFFFAMFVLSLLPVYASYYPNDGDTVLVTAINTDNYYMSVDANQNLSIKNYPIDSSLWIVHFKGDSVAFEHMIGGLFLQDVSSTNSLLDLVSTPDYWLLQVRGDGYIVANATTGNRMYCDRNGIFSGHPTGVSLINFQHYSKIIDDVSFVVSPDYVIADTSKQAVLFFVNSMQDVEYQYVDSPMVRAIYASKSFNHEWSVSEEWVSMRHDSLMIASLLDSLGRSTHLTLTIPEQNRTVYIPIYQYDPTTELSLVHSTGMGDNGLQNGLQPVHRRDVTYYVDSDEDFPLVLPLSLGHDSEYLYQRWYNLSGDTSLLSSFYFSDQMIRLSEGDGFFRCYAPLDTVWIGVEGLSVVREVACDVSGYSDGGIKNTLFYEPTLSYRVVYHLLPASEIATRFLQQHASGTAPTQALEHYDIVAPKDRVVRVSTIHDLIGKQASYFAYTGSNTIEQVQNLTLLCNGVALSTFLMDGNRTIVLDAETENDSMFYQLQGSLSDGTQVLIAEFNLKYRALSDLSRSTLEEPLVSPEYLKKLYVQCGAACPSEPGIEEHFASWENSELAFAYHTPYKTLMGRYVGILPTSAFVGEYQFISSNYQNVPLDIAFSIDEWPHLNDADTTFCYVDGGGLNSTIAQFPFQADVSRSDATYFVTYYVSNLSSQMGNEPHLTVWIEGQDTTDSYVPLLVFPSGDLNVEVGKWSQHGLSFKLPKTPYKNYRVRLSSDMHTYSGNDEPLAQAPRKVIHQSDNNTLSSQPFAINNLALYQSSDEFYAVGRPTACELPTDSLKYSILRLNLGTLNIFTSKDSALLSVKCVDSLSQIIPIQLTDGSTLVDSLSFTVRNLDSLPSNYHVYIGDTLLTWVYNDSIPVFYVQDLVDEDTVTWFYMLVKSDCWVAGNTYSWQLSEIISTESITDLAENNFMPSVLTLYQLQDLEWLPVTQGIVVADSVSLKLSYQVLTDVLDSTWYAGCFDWLQGTSSDYSPTGFYSAFNYDSIIVALSALHSDSSYRATLQLPDSATATLSQSQIHLLDTLIALDRLDLHQTIWKGPLYDSASYMVLYPYDTSFHSALLSTSYYPCQEAIPITILLNSDAYYIVFGNLNEISTAAIKTVRTIRLTQSQLMTQYYVPVKQTNLDTISRSIRGIVQLLSTNDTAAYKNYQGDTLYKGLYLSTIDGQKQLLIYDFSGGAFTYKIGYLYRYIMTVYDSLSSKRLGYQMLDVYAQPDVLKWGGGVNSSWNNTGNWLPVDSMGDSMTSPSVNYAPSDYIDVIIPYETTIPILYKDSSLDTGRTENLDTYLGYERNTAQNIFLDTGAMFIGQAYLDYDSVFMQVSIPTNQWVFMSAPIRGLVSGDFYKPQNDTITTLFESGALCDGRLKSKFWQSVYNSYVVSQDFNTQVTLGQLGWSSPLNGLNTPLVPRSAFFVWAESSVDNLLMRWPKADTLYYYYGPDNTQTSYYEDIDRTDNYYKLAYIDSLWSDIPTVELFSDSLNIAVVGNPFMALMSITQFFAANPQFNGSYWLYRNQELIATSLSGLSTSTLSLIDSIKPYEGFFVEMNTDSLFSLTKVNMTPSMTYPSVVTSSMPSKETFTEGVLRIESDYGGFTSTALIACKSDASADYVQREDVRSLSLGASITPSILYTVAQQKALQINVLPQINRVPLVLERVGSGNYGDTFTLTFTGSSTFSGGLYLEDSFTGELYRIMENSHLEVEVPQGSLWRYYITYNAGETLVDEESMEYELKVVRSAPSEITLYTNYPMSSLSIYDALGRQLIDKRLDGIVSASLTLTPGIYLVEVMCGEKQLVQRVVVY